MERHARADGESGVRELGRAKLRSRRAEYPHERHARRSTDADAADRLGARVGEEQLPVGRRPEQLDAGRDRERTRFRRRRFTIASNRLGG